MNIRGGIGDTNREVINLLIVYIRAVLLYIVIIFCVRLMGKRQLGELQPSELVVTIMLSNIATLPIEDVNIPLAMGLIPILTIVCLDVFFSYLTMKSGAVRRLLCGSPKVLISDGKLDQNAMRRLRFTVDDLFEALRAQQVFDISQVQLAMVETTGQISVYVKKEFQPVTLGDLGEQEDDGDPPVVLIEDGVLVRGALSRVKRDGKWLKRTLAKEGVTEQDVFIMTCDGSGKTTVLKKEENR